MHWNWNAAKGKKYYADWPQAQVETDAELEVEVEKPGVVSFLAWIINASKILIACTWKELQTSTSDVRHCRA